MKNKLSTNLLLIIGALIVLAIPVATMSIRDNTFKKKCFEFKVSYPGIEKYDNCVKSLKLSDYIDTLI